MSDTQHDPLLGLLTDIAEGVATLSARVDTMEAANVAHQAQVNEALATIAEIAARAYYATKPSDPLPDEVINTGVMDALIERWPRDAAVGMSNTDRQALQQLHDQPDETVERMIAIVKANPDHSNAGRLRMRSILALLNRAKEQRAQRRQPERQRNGEGRSRT